MNAIGCDEARPPRQESMEAGHFVYLLKVGLLCYPISIAISQQKPWEEFPGLLSIQACTILVGALLSCRRKGPTSRQRWYRRRGSGKGARIPLRSISRERSCCSS